MRQIISLICFLLPAVAIAATPAPRTPSNAATVDHGATIKLSPSVHAIDHSREAVAEIPLSAIAPFLKQSLIVEKDQLNDAPTLIGAPESRVVTGGGDTVYAAGLTDGGDFWQIYRLGAALSDPDSREVLGYEARYVGEARVEERGETSTLRILRATQEIRAGDRLLAKVNPTESRYFPHAPAAGMNAKIIAIDGGLTRAGKHAVVILNRGTRDGLESGHLLDLLHQTARSTDAAADSPRRRYGKVLVFRCFERVAFALVLEAQLPVELLDSAQTPQ